MPMLHSPRRPECARDREAARAMVQINMAEREIIAEGGLLRPRAVRQDDQPAAAPRSCWTPSSRGKMVTLDTTDDRTLYFDFLPIEFGTANGFSVKLKLFTVPGQVMHKSTRKVVLAGADAVVFVADSQRASAPRQRLLLARHGGQPQVERDRLRRDPEGRAVQQARPARREAARRDQAGLGRDPDLPGGGDEGRGRARDLPRAAAPLYRAIDERHEFGAKFGVSEEDFLKGVLANFRKQPASAAPAV